VDGLLKIFDFVVLDNDAHRFLSQFVLQHFPTVFSLDDELVFHLQLGLHLQILFADLLVAFEHEL